MGKFLAISFLKEREFVCPKKESVSRFFTKFHPKKKTDGQISSV
jgi:hypothetical protein